MQSGLQALREGGSEALQPLSEQAGEDREWLQGDLPAPHILRGGGSGVSSQGKYH